MRKRERERERERGIYDHLAFRVSRIPCLVYKNDRTKIMGKPLAYRTDELGVPPAVVGGEQSGGEQPPELGQGVLTLTLG